MRCESNVGEEIIITMLTAGAGQDTERSVAGHDESYHQVTLKETIWWRSPLSPPTYVGVLSQSRKIF